MGKTIESYRIALEDEISRWQGFSKALRKEDREAFEALMDACRLFASAGSNALRAYGYVYSTISAKEDTQVREGVRCNQAVPCRSMLKVGSLMFTLLTSAK